MSEEEQAEGIRQFGPLPSIGDAVRDMASGLTRAGVHTGGDPLLDIGQGAFLAKWLDLLPDTGDEPVIVHFSGHGAKGANGGLYLATAGADARDRLLDKTCVGFDQLLAAAENGGRPVLFLLDVCGAGQALIQQQLQDLAARRPQGATRNAWIIGACTSDADTYQARFTSASATVLHRLADGTLDLTPTLEHVPVDTLAAAIDRELSRADRAAGRAGQIVVRTPQVEASTVPQPFLRNPAHRPDSHAAQLDGMDPRLREFAQACSPGLDPLHFATRAAGNANADIIYFSGRASALRRIEEWINHRDTARDPLLVVTGGPGSGKSALLGVTACLTHPQLAPLRARVRNVARSFRPNPDGRVLAVHARQLSLQQIINSLHHQLKPEARNLDDRRPISAIAIGTGELLEELRSGGVTLVILDALDEALDPSSVVNELILPLVSARDSHLASGIRVMIGTRPWWDALPQLHQYTLRRNGVILDLDPVTERDRRDLADDLHIYLDLVLDTRYPADRIRDAADRIAHYTDSGAFLVAALYADHLLTAADHDHTLPPCSITEVFDLHRATLAGSEPWIRPVLSALGRAQGQGMPLDLIHAVALAHRPPAPDQPTPQLKDTRRALNKAAFYLRTTPDSEQRLLYRYFHQALTDHTAPFIDPATVLTALLSVVPVTAAGKRDWEHAPPYLLRHAAAHARAAGGKAFDRLLKDAGYLVHADPDFLTPQLGHAASGKAVLHALIYRSSTAQHPERHRASVRRDLLAVDAANWRRPGLARAIAGIPLSGRPSSAVPVWATHQSSNPVRRHNLTGHMGSVHAVATAPLPDGMSVAVTVGDDATGVVWDLVTGARRHTLTGLGGPQRTVTTAVLPDGTCVAVIGGSNGVVTVWNLVTGVRLHTLSGHASAVRAVATAVLPGGVPVAVTAADEVIVWNLLTGNRRHDLPGPSDWLNTLATTILPDGTPLAVATGNEETMIVWDLLTGTRRHTFRGSVAPASPMTTAVLPNGTAVALAGSTTGTVGVWDLMTGTCRTLTEFIGRMEAVETVSLPDGTPLAIITSDHNPVTVWNVADGDQYPLHLERWNRTRAVTTTTLPDGTPLVVTAGDDGILTVSDLISGARHLLFTDHADGLIAATATVLPDGTPVAISVDKDDTETVVVWDLKASTHHSPLRGHTGRVNAVATTALPNGTRLAVTASDDGSSMVWDLATGERRHFLTRHKGPVRTMTTAVLPDGTPLAITTSNDGTTVVWSMELGTRRHTLPKQLGWVNAMVTTALPNGRPLIVTASDGGTMIVSDLVTGTHRQTLTTHGIPVRALASTALPNGTPLVISGSEDGNMIVWYPYTGNRRDTLSAHMGPVRTVTTAVLPDGTPLAITTSHEQVALAWDLAAGDCRHILMGHSGWVNAVATTVLPNGTPVAVTTSNDKTAILWNLVTGDVCQTFTGHTAPVLGVGTAKLPDGSPVAVTTSNDGTMIVWNLATRQQVYQCRLPDVGHTVVGTPEGFLISYGPDIACFAWTDENTSEA